MEQKLKARSPAALWKLSFWQLLHCCSSTATHLDAQRCCCGNLCGPAYSQHVSSPQSMQANCKERQAGEHIDNALSHAVVVVARSLRASAA
jgi:sRNA-binding protein